MSVNSPPITSQPLSRAQQASVSAAAAAAAAAGVTISQPQVTGVSNSSQQPRTSSKCCCICPCCGGDKNKGEEYASLLLADLSPQDRKIIQEKMDKKGTGERCCLARGLIKCYHDDCTPEGMAAQGSGAVRVNAAALCTVCVDLNLLAEMGIKTCAYGINNALPGMTLTAAEAHTSSVCLVLTKVLGIMALKLLAGGICGFGCGMFCYRKCVQSTTRVMRTKGGLRDKYDMAKQMATVSLFNGEVDKKKEGGGKKNKKERSRTVKFKAGTAGQIDQHLLALGKEGPEEIVATMDDLLPPIKR